MAETLPAIRITPNTREAAATDDAPKQAPASASFRGGFGRARSPETNESRPLSNGKGYPNKFIPTFASNQTSTRNSLSEGRENYQAIDPLSNVILKRTHTSTVQQPKMRSTAASDEDNPSEPAPTAASARTSTEPHVTRTESTNSVFKDKRNRASFFSRFVAPKKKDASVDVDDEASETGDRRTEGMDASVFSRPIGYVPQFPQPPKYIKVRVHGKKEKDFDRVFLAQELRGRSGVEIAQSGGRPVKNGSTKSETRKDSSAVWALEFSKDGKHLAAGGKDYVVRIWQVLSDKEDRQAHELHEEKAGQEGQKLSAPVFKSRTVQEYSGHTASILDLSWSKNNFLLSSSMDKTVRLWHVSREECLCCFKHNDFVTSIQFHPRDDRFFLAGSLDSKLRLWSIPDKSVAYWNTLPDLITAVSFAPDGKTAIAGCLNGLCLFYETEGLKYQTQLHVRSAHGKNAKGSKITGIKTLSYPPDIPNGEVKILITSNDSRIRVYNLRDKGLELKLKGNENACSQIHATFSDDAKYIICGSEDRKAYIWPTGPSETDKEKRPVELFEAHQAIVTTAIIAPTRTRQLLSSSGDPLYDLCNPPPVTLVSRTQSHTSSIPPTEDAQPSVPPTPASSDLNKTSKPEESPAYLARCKHNDGNVIITADFLGNIKVFRQDCAYNNRLRNNDSALSKKMLGRTNSVATKNSTRSSRNSLQLNNHSSDRILSWRQSINSANGSLDSFRHNSNTQPRSRSPRKSVGQASFQSRHHSQASPSLTNGSPQASHHRANPSIHKEGKESPGTTASSNSNQPKCDREKDPLMLQGEQSYMFWNPQVYQAQAAASSHLGAPKSGYTSATGSTTGSLASSSHDPTHLGVFMGRQATNVSRLSSEENSDADTSPGSGSGELTCARCASKSFKVRIAGAGKQVLVCNDCGSTA